MGAEAEHNRDIVTAEIAYSRALGNVYMGNLGPEKEAEALFNLGRIERLNGKLESSLENLKKSLEIDEQVNKADVAVIENTLVEIAQTFYEMNKIDEGTAYLDKIMATNNNNTKTGQSKRFTARVFNNYGKKLVEIGQQSKSEKYKEFADTIK